MTVHNLATNLNVGNIVHATCTLLYAMEAIQIKGTAHYINPA